MDRVLQQRLLWLQETENAEIHVCKKPHQINPEALVVVWIMNKAKLFASRDLINQTIKMKSLHVKPWNIRKISLHIKDAELDCCFLYSQFVNISVSKCVVICESCDLHINIYMSPLRDVHLIKAALL